MSKYIQKHLDEDFVEDCVADTITDMLENPAILEAVWAQLKDEDIDSRANNTKADMCFTYVWNTVIIKG